MALAATTPIVVESRVADPPLQLFTSEEAFRPNPTTVRFARAIQVKPGDLVFDIGTGIGPLAIKAALDGARHVHAVDPVPLHCDLARQNVAKYNAADRITIHQGRFFEPLEADPDLASLKADIIIGDVSGIADAVSHALGWYSPSVPTGGPDGADMIVEFLTQSRGFLRPSGSVYFPITFDLANADRILDTARACYRSVVNAFPKPWFEFPLTPAEVAAIHAAYDNLLPPYIQIHQGRTPFWRGQIMTATDPL
jgi:hypothetical protein